MSSFEIIYFELLDPEILSAASSILSLRNFCTLLRKIYTRTVMSCVYSEIFYFELLDPEILTNKAVCDTRFFEVKKMGPFHNRQKT